MVAKSGPIKYIYLPRRDGWMVTLTDMTYVLMTFFVLLLSMSSMDNKAFKETFGILNHGYGVLEFPAAQKLKSQPSLVDTNVLKIVDMATLTKALNARMTPDYAIDTQSSRNAYFDIRQTPRGIAIALNSDVFFDSGAAELKPGMGTILSAIAKVLAHTNYQVSIEGHTDNTGDLATNLMLSLKRAQGVLDYFVYASDMSPRRFSLAGYGPLQPRMPNDSLEGRVKNRRVEVVLLKDRL